MRVEPSAEVTRYFNRLNINSTNTAEQWKIFSNCCLDPITRNSVLSSLIISLSRYIHLPKSTMIKVSIKLYAIIVNHNNVLSRQHFLRPDEDYVPSLFYWSKPSAGCITAIFVIGLEYLPEGVFTLTFLTLPSWDALLLFFRWSIWLSLYLAQLP